MSILSGVAGTGGSRTYAAGLHTTDFASAPAPVADENTPNASTSFEPADTIELSASAKLRLERIEADRTAADNLVKALKGQSSSKGKFNYRGDVGERSIALYKSMNPNYTSHEVTAEDAIKSLNTFASVTEDTNPVLAAKFRVGPDFDPETMLNEIARQGDFDTALFRKSADEGPEAFLVPFTSTAHSKEDSAAIRAASQLALHYNDLQRAGLNEKAAAFRDAIENGGLHFQSAGKAENLDASYQKLQARAESGGTNTTYDLDLNPTGDTKDALETGDALIVKLGDLGAYYVTY
ncbi:hypothetical protein [uncultured Roseibium sp.]|uniref:hypothetical protein n=1 Tax=uncultured Roseibium sp. TaxID=1936171 RepID=UPI003216E828